MRLKLKIVTTFNEENMIIVCSEMRFSKTSYHVETSQLTSVTMKGISEQTLKLHLYFLSNLAIHQSWT